MSGLLAEEIDVALRVGARTSSTLVSRIAVPAALGDRRFARASSPGTGRRHAPPISAAATVSGSSIHGAARCRGGSPSGGEAPSPHEVTGNLLVNQGDLLLAAVGTGTGIAQLLDFMVTERVREGQLVEVLDGYTAAGPPIHAVTAPGTRSANVRAIIDFAGATFGRRAVS